VWLPSRAQSIHRDLPPTRAWGYGPPGSPSWPGPTIVASVGQAIHVTWINNLRAPNGSPPARAAPRD
jgi:FtsP/CotA-like multicopper oxidase with cupredoxin domain